MSKAIKPFTGEPEPAAEEKVEEIGRELCALLDLTPPFFIRRHGWKYVQPYKDSPSLRQRVRHPSYYHDIEVKKWTIRVFTDTMAPTHSPGGRAVVEPASSLVAAGVYVAHLPKAQTAVLCRVQPSLSGGFEVSYDNERYKGHRVKKGSDAVRLLFRVAPFSYLGREEHDLIKEARELGIIPTWQ